MVAPTVYVVGVGMIPFVKPGESDPYPVMGARAVRAALADAGLDYTAIQQAYTGILYADSTAGQAVLYGVGMTGIPVINVNNNCASGIYGIVSRAAGGGQWRGGLRVSGGLW